MNQQKFEDQLVSEVIFVELVINQSSRGADLGGRDFDGVVEVLSEFQARLCGDCLNVSGDALLECIHSPQNLLLTKVSNRYPLQLNLLPKTGHFLCKLLNCDLAQSLEGLFNRNLATSIKHSLQLAIHDAISVLQVVVLVLLHQPLFHDLEKDRGFLLTLRQQRVNLISYNLNQLSSNLIVSEEIDPYGPPRAEFHVRVKHRRIVCGLLQHHGCPSLVQFLEYFVSRAIDVKSDTTFTN